MLSAPSASERGNDLSVVVRCVFAVAVLAAFKRWKRAKPASLSGRRRTKPG